VTGAGPPFQPDRAFCKVFADMRRVNAALDEAAGRHILIAAPSGRALACAARRAGLVPLVVDMFGDGDVRALAACRVAQGGASCRFESETLIPLLEELEKEGGEKALGVVYGGGFEDRPQTLRDLAARWPLLGASPEAVERVKDPRRFAAALAILGAPHPEIRMSPPERLSGWLVKRQGGGGGGHVQDAESGAAPEGRVYYQRRAEGRPVSALFLAAAGKGCMALGFSEQWTSPCKAHPYRYGGAVRPAALDAQTMAEMETAVCRAARAFRLTGLGSADFIVDGRNWTLLEINPRPGATLDIFDSDETPLLALHLAAVAGDLPETARPLPGAAAAEVVYADRDVERVSRCDWPEWLSDRPPPGASLSRDDPFCTVRAEAATAAEARLLSRARAMKALRMLETRKHDRD
jgi:predicted ATP-grasp superfamily ATP-dependent carboligase